MELKVRGIHPDVVRTLLETDDAGRRPVLKVDDEGGSPLRCCLTKARPGERIALLSYAPLRRWAAETGVDPGAYDEVGPVFVHAEPCEGVREAGWPEAHTAHRMLRAYTAQGTIAGGEYLAKGEDPEVALKELLEDPGVAVVHVRAVEFGCFQFEVRRAS
ncbi:DUF1203 domain-containing protein [Nonomuraea sp. NPDC050663]|uniref:DUF1203 domain-containing protein n=1 Tax=Nonomuraea sp. NPDC050663 TaxID=3364370 RepID=UPI0037B9F665